MSNTMWVKCGPCAHVWIAMHLPMEMSKAATIMKRLCCPKCGETKKIYMAEKADIPSEEKLNG